MCHVHTHANVFLPVKGLDIAGCGIRILNERYVVKIRSEDKPTVFRASRVSRVRRVKLSPCQEFSDREAIKSQSVEVRDVPDCFSGIKKYGRVCWPLPILFDIPDACLINTAFILGTTRTRRHSPSSKRLSGLFRCHDSCLG